MRTKLLTLLGRHKGDQEAVKECYKEYIGMVKIYYEGAQRSKQGRPGEIGKIAFIEQPLHPRPQDDATAAVRNAWHRLNSKQDKIATTYMLASMSSKSL
ncbi:hypothetical protein Tco_0949723 [Tanacetum coccineum]